MLSQGWCKVTNITTINGTLRDCNPSETETDTNNVLVNTTDYRPAHLCVNNLEIVWYPP